MRRSSLVTAVALGVAGTATNAEARLDVYVDKSAQLLSVIQDGALLYVWPVSTGVGRHSTPSGVYTPERLERSWFSRAYYNSPMPYAIFFHDGYAIHGSYDIEKLGGPASHGCVRLHPRNAAILFSMVAREGPGNTAIFVGGDTSRAPLRRPDVDDAPGPAWRRDDTFVRSDPPPPPLPAPPPGGRRYADGPAEYPPPPPLPRLSPYFPERSVGGRAWPARPEPYYEPDRYEGNRDEPHMRNDYSADPYADERGLPPDRSVDPYVDGRGGYRPAPPPFYPPDRRADGHGAALSRERGPSALPSYDTADRHADALMRRNGDLPAVRDANPASRPPALHFNEAPQRPPRNGAQPVTAAVRPNPGPTLGPNPGPGPGPGPGRPADEPADRRTIAGEAARTLPTAAPLPAAPAVAAAVPRPRPASSSPSPAPAARAEPPRERAQERPQPAGAMGYRVLPPSYWAGASWRWRAPPDTASHDPQ
jgi:hypothetical protein